MTVDPDLPGVMPTALIAVARSLAIDTMSAEVVAAMQAAALDPILIKGPTIAQWLYDESEPRPYVDSDIFVAPAHQADAGRVLSKLGFKRELHAWEIRKRLFHAGSWYRKSDKGSVDLHLTLPGIRGAAPEAVWAALTSRTVPFSLPQGVTVRALDLPARALLVALHAVHHIDHGFEELPLADLRRAIDRAEPATWVDAAALAVELRSGGDVSRALHAVEGGPELAEQLGLPAPASGSDETVGIERIFEERGPRERGRALRRALFPDPSYLRYTLPSARRGPLWLAMAYLRRPFSLARRFPRSYRAWRATNSQHR